MSAKHDPNIDTPLLRGLTQTRLSRRDLLRYAGVGAGAVSLSALLAACSSGGPSAGSGASASIDPKKLFAGEPNGIVNFGNWPLYIDQTRAGGEKTHPSLDLFTKETGIEVNYREVIQDNESFYATIRPLLQAGQYTGWDIIVITNGLTLPQLIDNNYLVPLDHDRTPNFNQYASDSVKNPSYDPGNKYTMAWQSGLTGIGYDPNLTGRDITSLQDLFDPAFKGKVGMMGNNLDLPSLGLLAIGVQPDTSTPDDWQKAADTLVKQRDDGIVRQYYDQSYIQALRNGDVAISMAWSGDIFQSNLSGYENLKFVVPSEGALFWTDNMCIPIGVQNPVDAITMMDFVYRPDVQATIEDWVNYISPVPGAQEIIRTELKDPTVADSALVFPTADDQKLFFRYPSLDAQQAQQWNSLFQPIYQS